MAAEQMITQAQATRAAVSELLGCSVKAGEGRVTYLYQI
jgi:hypothetical protein